MRLDARWNRGRTIAVRARKMALLAPFAQAERRDSFTDGRFRPTVCLQDMGPMADILRTARTFEGLAFAPRICAAMALLQRVSLAIVQARPPRSDFEESATITVMLSAQMGAFWTAVRKTHLTAGSSTQARKGNSATCA